MPQMGDANLFSTNEFGELVSVQGLVVETPDISANRKRAEPLPMTEVFSNVGDEQVPPEEEVVVELKDLMYLSMATEGSGTVMTLRDLFVEAVEWQNTARFKECSFNHNRYSQWQSPLQDLHTSAFYKGATISFFIATRHRCSRIERLVVCAVLFEV